MRLTREILLKYAQETANQRARVSRRIQCIYLTGSLLEESPLLGGTTDIDLVIVHDSEPIQQREVVRLTDEIHLDISHYDQSVFRQPRHLRADPWLGPFLYSKPVVFHDTQHWFDFIQASAGAQFFQPETILQRANTLSQRARQSWMDLQLQPERSQPERVYKYLQSLENAGNALVSLIGEGKPLAERRFLLLLPQRLQALDQPELIGDLVHLFLPRPEQLELTWSQWVEDWEKAYRSASALDPVLPALHPCRRLYYQRAFPVLWEENHSAAAWLLFRTWTLSASQLPAESPGIAAWQTACQALDLDEANFPERLEALDRYLDRVEETLDLWARQNGVSRVANL